MLPDLRGYGAEAVHELARLGLTPRVSGVGIVVDQRPRPAPPRAGNLCTLVLDATRRRPSCRECRRYDTRRRRRGGWRRGLDVRPSLRTHAVTAIAYDSRSVRPGAVFVALRGQKADGASFAAQAIARGAIAVIAERRPAGDSHRPVDAGARRAAALALLADRFFGSPSRRMPVIGVTGTNGKTTTGYLLAAVLDAAASAPA